MEKSFICDIAFHKPTRQLINERGYDIIYDKKQGAAYNFIELDMPGAYSKIPAIVPNDKNPYYSYKLASTNITFAGKEPNTLEDVLNNIPNYLPCKLHRLYNNRSTASNAVKVTNQYYIIPKSDKSINVNLQYSIYDDCLIIVSNGDVIKCYMLESSNIKESYPYINKLLSLCSFSAKEETEDKIISVVRIPIMRPIPKNETDVLRSKFTDSINKIAEPESKEKDNSDVYCNINEIFMVNLHYHIKEKTADLVIDNFLPEINKKYDSDSSEDYESCKYNKPPYHDFSTEKYFR